MCTSHVSEHHVLFLFGIGTVWLQSCNVPTQLRYFVIFGAQNVSAIISFDQQKLLNIRSTVTNLNFGFNFGSLFSIRVDVAHASFK